MIAVGRPGKLAKIFDATRVRYFAVYYPAAKSVRLSYSRPNIESLTLADEGYAGYL
jgi:hypothetical protein